MKHKLYAPLMVSTLNDKTRKIYLEKLKEAGTDFVFIAPDRKFGEDNVKQYENFTESIKFFEDNGFECGAWTTTIGLCGRLSNRAKELTANFTLIRGLDKEALTDTDQFCILNDGLFNHIIKDITMCIESGAKLVMLDDDLCLSLRYGIGCACDEHMELFYKKMGERPDRKEIYKAVVSGAPNKYRTAWMECMGDSLKDFCKKLRDAVDKIDPTVRMGFCSGYTSWDEEGVDALTLTKILAGNTKPFLRLTGAPYWMCLNRFDGQNLQSIIEFVIEQTQWCAGEEIELFDENDTYPRPRHIVPAAYSEIYDLCLRFATNIGSFKYMYDYTSGPDYETGYLKAHLANKHLRDWAENNSLPNKEGIIVIDKQRKLKEITLPDEGNQEYYTKEVFRNGQRFITKNSIPVKYSGTDNTCVVFGECARYFNPQEYKKGIILDLPAAIILQEKGIDLGIVDYSQGMPWTEKFGEGEVVAIDANPGRLYRVKLSEKAKVLSLFDFEDEETPASFTVTGDNGEKYLIYAFDGNSAAKLESGVYCSYYRQKQLVEQIRAMGGNVKVMGYEYPNLYVLTSSDDRSVSVFMANINPDVIYTPEFELDDIYTKCELINADAYIKGNKLIFNTDIVPYSCVGIRLFK